MDNFWTGVVHGIAAVIVFGGTAFLLQAPADWQTLTLGGLIAALVKWGHLAYNS